jgi:hypothetical protein
VWRRAGLIRLPGGTFHAGFGAPLANAVAHTHSEAKKPDSLLAHPITYDKYQIYID